MAIAWTKWRTRAHLGAAVFVILIQVINGYEELYTISQLSPKSVSEDSLPRDAVLQTRQADNIAFRIEPSRYDDDDDIPAETIIDDEEREKHVIVARSADLADRESRSINIDEIPISNHNEIDGDLELYNKRKYYDIHPTKTMADLQDRQDKITPSENFGDRLNFRFPGEVNRVPNARALASGPKIRPTAVQPIFATATHKEQGRQNTEIQNIITGIVKLLNGNVNVQANTQLLRPGRPMNSRINNRGPPRISDVPPLPDFDKPITPPPHSFVPTKLPPPYPFDRPPHHGVNLPEQIVPPLNPSRPGFHRPHPPWSRPRPRPPNRRPIPGLPMYKPMPPVPHDIPDLDDAKPEEDITVSENETSHSENHLLHDENLPLSLPVPTAPVNEDHEDKITTMDEETTSSTSTTTELTTTSTTTEKPTEKPTTEEPTTTTEKPTTTTKKPTTTTKKPTTTTEKLTTKAKPTTTTTEKPKTEKPIKPDKKKDTYNAEKDKPNKEKHKLEEKVTNKTKTNSIIEGIFENITPSFSGIKPTMAVIDISTPTPNVGIVEQISHTPVESSMVESVFHTPSVDTQPLPSTGLPYHPYRPRPGIVLDDPDFKPHGTRFRPEASVITAAETRLPPGYGEIFDVTVSAIQGPGEKGGSVHIETVHPLHHGEHDDIIVSATGEQGFVSIDGKRTYLNLFDSSTVDASPTQHVQHNTAPPSLGAIGTGVAIPADDELPPPRRPSHPPHSLHPSHSSPHPTHPHPLHPNRQSPARPQQGYRRPQPTVRIDTCIVGDDSTCDQAQNEKCRTEAGISSCQCRPGFARRTHRDPCRRVVALVLNLRVDRIYDRKMAWDAKLADKESEPYQQLNYEAMRAVDSAFSMTPFSDDFVSCSLNAVHTGDDLHRGIYVNFTVLLQESPETLRHQISSDVQKHLLGVIRRRSNNVGASNLWVHSPTDSVLPLTDLDECASSDFNDCHHLATCTNTWGGFRCLCPDTTLDSSPLPGRDCKACAASHCNDRGVCRYRDKQPYCSCTSGYYGSTCEVDGEVVGVAVGASLAAALVIALTLAALLSWSRKWSREQKAIGMGSPVFNYMAANTIKTPPVGQPPYQVSIEERMRWAQIAEAMAQSNHYAPDPAQTMVTRPSSAMFGGYPTLPPVPMPRMGLHNPHMSTLNTVASRANTAASHHNMYGYTNHMATESTSSEASSHVQERADLLVPRPKSRARSMHNQSNIYYDVEYENAPEAIYGTKGIPLSTYTISRGPPFYRS